jgi:hypothetical protein
MLKEPPVVVGLETSSPELSLSRLVRLLGDDLPAVVFSDDPVTKIHDSLPTVPFRNASEAMRGRRNGLGRIFLSVAVINEGMSHKQIDTYDRVGWFQMAHTYLMKFMAPYESSQTGPGIKPFGRKNDGTKVPRFLFDRKLMMHATNIIAEIVYEIKKTTKPILPSTCFNRSC